MQPAVRDFLERALQACQRCDPEGTGVLPFDEWPGILEDLGLQENGDGCKFLMEHLAAAGEDMFTYEPLAEAVRANAAPPPPCAPPDERGPAAERFPERGHSGYDRDSPRCDEPYSSSHFAELGYDERAGRHTCHAGNHSHNGSAMPPGPSAPPRLHGHPSLHMENGLPAVGPANGHPVEDFGNMAPVPEDVNEAFWARRAVDIQQLFNKWDCNELTNDSFTARLQEVLGEPVDVSHPDSEFVKLANKHRSARNMKFAALMSALRKDAQMTSTRRFGRPLTASVLSSYAGAYAGSTYEPSEAASEVHSHAAGRPTGSGAAVVNPSIRSGRRHYPYADSHLHGAVHSAEMQPDPALRTQAAPSRAEGPTSRPVAPPSPAGSTTSHLGPMPSLLEPRREGPAVVTGVAARAGAALHAGGPAMQKAHRQLPPEESTHFKLFGGGEGVDSAGHDRSDVASVAAASEAFSVADSQREIFTNRNRTGHGNILTWGSDSRSLTPGKKRQGKQVTVDPEKGVPRAHVASGAVILKEGGPQGF